MIDILLAEEASWRTQTLEYLPDCLKKSLFAVFLLTIPLALRPFLLFSISFLVFSLVLELPVVTNMACCWVKDLSPSPVVQEIVFSYSLKLHLSWTTQAYSPPFFRSWIIGALQKGLKVMSLPNLKCIQSHTRTSHRGDDSLDHTTSILFFFLFKRIYFLLQTHFLLLFYFCMCCWQKTDQTNII